ncbi:hypothetical protein OU5_1627 [Pseudomonas mandelii JR-1]|uniref:Uncharacterized protein n=1 Tax=Pseudomonas mandelii JR-1 TaxID=1147786 RepID=A0A024E7X3_9PSED|nr:hypothetical protein OU5_1627 [Pseudomonas mandelii JR-1]
MHCAKAQRQSGNRANGRWCASSGCLQSTDDSGSPELVFAKLDQIKDQLLFWKLGGQSMQLLAKPP